MCLNIIRQIGTGKHRKKNSLPAQQAVELSTISSMSCKTGKRIKLILLIHISKTNSPSPKDQPSSEQEIEMKKNCSTKIVEQIFRTRA